MVQLWNNFGVFLDFAHQFGRLAVGLLWVAIQGGITSLNMHGLLVNMGQL